MISGGVISALILGLERGRHHFVSFALLWLLRDDEQDATVDDVPIKLPSSAVTTVVQPVLTVDQRPSEPALEAYDAEIVPIPEVDQKEAIRATMSELGKRSAMARAKKKAERGNQAE